MCSVSSCSCYCHHCGPALPRHIQHEAYAHQQQARPQVHPHAVGTPGRGAQGWVVVGPVAPSVCFPASGLANGCWVVPCSPLRSQPARWGCAQNLTSKLMHRLQPAFPAADLLPLKIRTAPKLSEWDCSSRTGHLRPVPCLTEKSASYSGSFSSISLQLDITFVTNWQLPKGHPWFCSVLAPPWAHHCTTSCFKLRTQW